MSRFLNIFKRNTDDQMARLATAQDAEVPGMAALIVGVCDLGDTEIMGRMPDDSETGVSAAVAAFLAPLTDPQAAARLAEASYHLT